MLLDGDDLREMGLPKGPVKTILKATEDRRKDMDEDSPIEDTPLWFFASFKNVGLHVMLNKLDFLNELLIN
jgi:hypothetical protein